MLFVQCCKPWMGDDMQQIFYTCHELKMSWNNVFFFFFVTVMNQKSALATWGMRETLCFMLVCDGNKARAKNVNIFYRVPSL